MKKPGFLSAMWVGLALVAGGVQAHDDAYLDTVKTAHGGQLRMAGMYHFELVVEKSAKGARDNPVVVYVTDHAGTSIPTAGSSGTATLLAGKDKGFESGGLHYLGRQSSRTSAFYPAGCDGR